MDLSCRYTQLITTCCTGTQGPNDSWGYQVVPALLSFTFTSNCLFDAHLMEIFGRSKAKGKRRPDPIASPRPTASSSTTNSSSSRIYSSSPPSPSSHPIGSSIHSSTASNASVDDYFSG